MADRVLVEYTDKKGTTQNLWVLTGEVATAKKNAAEQGGSVTVVPKARVRVRTPWNTQVVREYTGATVPENIRQMIESGGDRSGWSADLLSQADSAETTTPGFQEGTNIARYHAGQLIKAIPDWTSRALPGGGGIWGLLGRGATQFTASTLGDVAGRAVAGEKQDPASSMMTGAVLAGGNMAFDAASQIPGRIAEGTYAMSGVGNVKPGVKNPRMPAQLMKKNLPVTMESLTQLENAVTAYGDAAKQLIDNSTATTGSQRFGDRLKSWITIQKRSNVLSKSGEAALQRMMKTLNDRLGGGTRVSPILSPSGQPIVQNVPWSDLTASAVDEIRQIAENESRALRVNKAGQKSKTVAAEMKAWDDLYKEAIRTLNEMDPEIGRLRREQRLIIDQRDAVSNALVQGKTGTLFNAAFRLLGGPGMTSKAGLALANPALPDRIRTVPALSANLIRLGYYLDSQGRIQRANPLGQTYQQLQVKPSSEARTR